MNKSATCNALFVKRIAGKAGSINYARLTFEVSGRSERAMTVLYSSINFKDRLVCKGNGVVTRRKEIVPGIDAVGLVDDIVVSACGSDLGVDSDGGWSELCRVRTSELVEVPKKLDVKWAAIYGTAGLTAALIVQRIESVRSLKGASILIRGGGSVSWFTTLMLLNLGYSVSVATRSPQTLANTGVDTTYSLEELDAMVNKPLGRSIWGVIIDLLGGPMMSPLCANLNSQGHFFVVGNVLGNLVPAFSLNPLFSRGITIYGINLQSTSLDVKRNLWAILEHHHDFLSCHTSYNLVKFEALKSYLENSSDKRSRTIIQFKSGELQ